MRASWAYWVMNGFVAASTAAIQPARLPNSACAAQKDTGIASVANSSESVRAPGSEVPANRIQPCSST